MIGLTQQTVPQNGSCSSVIRWTSIRFVRWAFSTNARSTATVFVLMRALSLPLALGAQAPAPALVRAAAERPAPAHGGYTDYTAYPCLAVGGRMADKDAGTSRLTWRDRWPDTATAAKLKDSLFLQAANHRRIGELKKCLATHPLGTTPMQRRLGLGLAWLAADDETQANTVFHAVIADHAKRPIEERALVLSQIVEAYLDGDPKHIPNAEVYLAQLDALGTSVAGRRLAMHNRFYSLAQAMDSLPLMSQQVQVARKISEELTGDSLRAWVGNVIGARLNEADFEARRGNFAVAVKVLEAAGKELAPIGEGGAFDLELWGKYKLYGTPAKPLVPTFVGQFGQTTLSKTLPPLQSGRLSLRVYVDKSDYAVEKSIPLYSLVREIIRDYGSKINVVLITETSGYDYPKLVANSEEESQHIIELFHNYLQIPAPIVIHANTLQGKKVDGRLQYFPNPNWMMAQMVLVDAQGNYRNIDNGGGGRLKQLIKELTAEKPPA